MRRINLKAKIAFVAMILLCFVTLIGGVHVFADETSDTKQENLVQNIDGIVDSEGKDGEYKLSSDKNEIYLPFFRAATGRIEIDKPINKLGFITTQQTIDVNSELKNIQFLLSQDSIRYNQKVEYALALTSKDVVINQDIERNAIILAGGTVTIEENANINDDLIVLADSVNIKGKVNASCIITAGNIKISGEIKNDLRCETDNLEISGNENVKGKIYVKTYNKDLNIKDKYSDAIVKLQEKEDKAKSFGNVILKALITCLMYTIIYLIVKKVTKGKAYEKMLDKAKNNTLFVVLSSTIFLLAFPVLSVFLLLFSFFGLYVITLPILIAYIAFLLIFVLLAKYIVGSTIFEYINKKYMKADKLFMELVGVYFTFLSLTLITKIPFIGTYLGMAFVMLSIGIVLTCILKKDKVKENNTNENN